MKRSGAHATDMLSFNSGTGISSISPLGAYVGYLLVDSGNVWVGAIFLLLTAFCFFLTASAFCRFIINYRRNPQVDMTTSGVH
ncbi:hypothetical protein IT396_01755 [Candidatus Nomurabacteria bacterium]|nr:hypothetical protein [Candidatus Nomurabacteria bacterium]